MSIITAAPTRGRNTAALSPQWWIRSVMDWFPCCSTGEDEDRGQDGRTREQVGAVGLHLAVLRLPQSLARGLCVVAGAVHQGVDDALVDLGVHEVAGLAGIGARAVHHAVEDVLVEPVRRL